MLGALEPDRSRDAGEELLRRRQFLGVWAVRATARTSAGSAPVSLATTRGFAASAITSPGGSVP